MSATPLVMIVHNHQPVGNLPWVIEDCYRSAYFPFLNVLERHPGIRLGMHFTGPLLEWLQQEHPDYLARVRALVEGGQVEVLGGGFYEPILPVIPERDRIGQLELMRETVAAQFGAAPTGAWLAERVWEPGLPGALAAAGMRYVLIDDEVFHRLGYAERDTCAMSITEDDGRMTRLLPISHRLRYTIPSRPAQEVLDTLRDLVHHGGEALIYGDDGERYGSWPGTYDFMYGEEAYLDGLFTALESAGDLQPTLPGELVRETAPRALVYLPPTSYAEMLDWSGGFWRNFLSRFRESNLMHKKMLAVSRWVEQAGRAGHDVREAQRELYAGQCNCAYWYGVFGGIYFLHLRRAIYEHLLKAERLVAPLLPATVRGSCEVVDFDCDGYDEVFLRSGDLSAGISPRHGGALFALEHLPSAYNFLATMARYPLPDSANARSEALPVDRYPRFAFLEHFLPPDATPEAVRDATCEEADDFLAGSYVTISVSDGAVLLQRQGLVRNDGESAPLQITKQYTLSTTGLEVSYRLTNPASTSLSMRFAPEFNACLSAAEMPERALIVEMLSGTQTRSLAETATCDESTGACYQDTWLKLAITMQWTQAAQLWIIPVYTPLCSMKGLEWVYQSTAILPVWEIALLPGESWQETFSIRVESVADVLAIPV